MLLGKKALIAVLIVAAWAIVSFYYRVAAIDANTAKATAQLVELEQRIVALDRRVSAVSDGLEQATMSMNDLRPEVAGNVAEVRTMLEETLPAIRADLNQLKTPPPASGGRR